MTRFQIFYVILWVQTSVAEADMSCASFLWVWHEDMRWKASRRTFILKHYYKHKSL